MVDKNDARRAEAVPENVGSGAEFERSKGIHLLPKVSADPTVLPPSAAVSLPASPQQAPSSTDSSPPPAPDGK